MIRVTIEMVPGGVERHAYKMHVIEIANDVAGTLESNGRRGNYRYYITRKLVKGRRPSTWKVGRVVGFPRAQKNSIHLLFAVLKDAIEGK